MGESSELQRVAAELEIRNVLARIAQNSDRGEVADYMALFAADAVWEMPDNPILGVAASSRTGHAEILEGVIERRAAGLQGPGANSLHVLTTLAVTVESDTEATANLVFMFVGNTVTSPSVQSIGTYHDRMRKTPKGWKLAHRTISMG